jgi:uncharacterized membrane protein YobD (UPF0266 family)
MLKASIIVVNPDSRHSSGFCLPPYLARPAHLIENRGFFCAWIFVSGYHKRDKKISENQIFVSERLRKWLKFTLNNNSG